MMKSIFFWLVATAILISAPATNAQQPGKIFRIGVLDSSTASSSAAQWQAIRQELSKLGWIEGKNIAIEYRFAEQKPERLPELATELVRLKVDLIVVSGGPTPLAMKKATSTIPIVMTTSVDPVGEGLIASLARPGGNITGNAGLSPELSTKRLEILKDAIPRLSRVGLLRTAGAGISITGELQVKDLRSAAQAPRSNWRRSQLSPTPRAWRAPFKPRSKGRQARL